MYVLGAGTDVAFGLPLANGVMPELAIFAKGEGKPIEQALRRQLGRFQFSFERHGGEKGDAFAEDLLDQPDTLQLIRQVLAKNQSSNQPTVEALRSVVEKLGEIAQSNDLSEDITKALAGFTGEENVGPGGDSLFRTRGLQMTNTPQRALRKLFQESLMSNGLSDNERETLTELVRAMSNFEELLGDLFAGFYTKNVGLQKRYLYISWLFWSYLRCSVARANRDSLSFYDLLKNHTDDCHVITFNYTNFFPSSMLSRVRFFHGDCTTYLRFDNREVIRNDEIVEAANDCESISTFINSLEMDLNKHRIYMPGIVPPLSMKPVISKEYLDMWYDCGKLISEADSIVIVGYSFNLADEHFNDLLRKGGNNSKLVVINPDMETTITNVTKLLGTRPEDLNPVQIGNLPCRRGGRLTFVPQKAEKVSAHLLTALE